MGVAAHEGNAVGSRARHTDLPRTIPAARHGGTRAGIHAAGQDESANAAEGVLSVISMHIHRMSRSSKRQDTHADKHENDSETHA